MHSWTRYVSPIVSLPNLTMAFAAGNFVPFVFSRNSGYCSEYNLICELDHGCDPIPVTRELIAGIQAADPRCSL